MDDDWIDPGGVGVAALSRARGQESTRLPRALVEAAREVELDEAELALGVALLRELPKGVSHEGWIGLVSAARLSAARGSTRLELGERLAPMLNDLALGATERALASAILATPDAFSPVLSRADSGVHSPLVLDDQSVYSQKTWALERRVASALQERFLATSLEDLPLADGLPLELSDEQSRAVRIAATAPLALVTGGPGTGKTSIVVAMLCTMANGGVDLSTVALAAPTGKAADRLRAGVQPTLLERGEPVPAASTLHRLLGYSERRGFRHHAGNPLSAEVVIVDEASMVDLEMMNRLLDALRPGGRLVLLGDADQLPSVDPGAVFRDVCLAADDVHPERIARLSKSYRMDPKDPSGRAVLLCAMGVNAGEDVPMDWVTTEAELAFEGAEGLESARLEPFLDRWWQRAGFETERRLEYPADLIGMPTKSRDALDSVLRAAERFRILTLTRSRRTGSLAINDALHRRASRFPGFALGEPVLVLRNDYDRGLFNGDQGVVLRVGSRVSVVFRRGLDFVAFPIEAVMGLVELAYAVTVHKAQGSEYEGVAMVLPDRWIPLLTREILYTGITRARRSAVVVGERSLFERGVATPLDRSSGLRGRVARGGVISES